MTSSKKKHTLQNNPDPLKRHSYHDYKFPTLIPVDVDAVDPGGPVGELINEHLRESHASTLESQLQGRRAGAQLV